MKGNAIYRGGSTATKRGEEKVKAMLKGGTQSFEVVLT